MIAMRARFPGGSTWCALLLLSLLLLCSAVVSFGKFGAAILSLQLARISLASSLLPVMLDSPGWTVVQSPLLLVGIEVEAVQELTVVDNPGKALGGSRLPGLAALAPETSEHKRLMLSLSLLAAPRVLLA